MGALMKQTGIPRQNESIPKWNSWKEQRATQELQAVSLSSDQFNVTIDLRFQDWNAMCLSLPHSHLFLLLTIQGGFQTWIISQYKKCREVWLKVAPRRKFPQHPSALLKGAGRSPLEIELLKEDDHKLDDIYCYFMLMPDFTHCSLAVKHLALIMFSQRVSASCQSWLAASALPPVSKEVVMFPNVSSGFETKTEIW